MTTIHHASRPDAEITDPYPAPSAIVAVAWPTGRPIHRYTAAEIADGVDLYTQAMKARAAGTGHQGSDDAPE
ncbi:hypothetical protein DDE19_27945 [Micromonospora ureilytica]|uniref:Uncharacterized protein n=1 Tax=Micromonospora ureilytica TaxID=709868 RepID=A0A3N9Y0A7_9ACTN|nr:hypothetical protein [Micromonospora ureilytica]RQX12697.1 hypothetical protein DDE19_27945 [Micromonospora ureilytica]